jgi:hypothetical protein
MEKQQTGFRMPFSGILRREVLVRTVVLEECVASIITVTIIGEPILVTPMIKATRSSKTTVLTRFTWVNIPEDGIFIVTFLNTSNLT